MGKIDTYIVKCNIKYIKKDGRKMKPLTINGIIYKPNDCKIPFTKANIEAHVRYTVAEILKYLLEEQKLTIADFKLTITLQGIDCLFRLPLGEL